MNSYRVARLGLRLRWRARLGRNGDAARFFFWFVRIGHGGVGRSSKTMSYTSDFVTPEVIPTREFVGRERSYASKS